MIIGNWHKKKRGSEREPCLKDHNMACIVRTTWRMFHKYMNNIEDADAICQEAGLVSSNLFLNKVKDTIQVIENTPKMCVTQSSILRHYSRRSSFGGQQ